MTYHKIRGIDKAICTCEQKIAYNMAFDIRLNFGDQWDKNDCNYIKHTKHNQMMEWARRVWFEKWQYAPYDQDAVWAAINAGLIAYMDNYCSILTNYAAIGAMFPANYKN